MPIKNLTREDHRPLWWWFNFPEAQIVQFSRGTDDEVASVEKLKERTWGPEISPDYLDPSSDPPLSTQPSQMEVLVQN